MKNILDFIRSNKKYVITGFVVIMFIFTIVDVYYCEENKPEESTYAEFQKDLNSGRIDTIYYTTSDEMMRYTLYNDKTRNMSKEDKEKYKYDKKDWRMTEYPAQEDFRKEMLEKGVSLQVRSFEPKSIALLTGIIFLAIPFLLFYMVLKMINGTQKIKQRDLVQTSNVKFSDVIGHDEVIDDLKFIVSLLKNPNKGNDLGAEIPRGILLSGEPGTGKTLLAKAVAGESDVPFIYMNASNFIELYVGTGAKRVRELFSIARKHQPCIIFIDEIDAIGSSRGSNRSNSENDQTINALLQEMDGFKDKGNIFVIGATNNPDSLDKALVRAGRFDRQVVIRPPKDWTVRKQLFDFYLKDCKLSDDVSTKTLSKQLVGFTGADINAVVNEAKLIAMMSDSEYMSMSNLEEAVDKVIFKGGRSKSEVYRKDKEIVAYHEAGHAVVTYLLGEPIARATIIPSTSGVGGVVFREEKSSQFQTDKDLENCICIAYGGRCAERIKFGVVTTGASSDIVNATNIISSYIEENGFNKNFGMLNMNILRNKGLIDNSHILKLMSEMAVKYERKTTVLLNNNFNLVELLAEKLLECETLSGDGILELFSQETRHYY